MIEDENNSRLETTQQLILDDMFYVFVFAIEQIARIPQQQNSINESANQINY